jgi:hypothetical protein
MDQVDVLGWLGLGLTVSTSMETDQWLGSVTENTRVAADGHSISML